MKVKKCRKILSLLFVVILVAGFFSTVGATRTRAANTGDDGTTNGYTEIYTAQDLDNVRNNLSGNYILMNDIDLSSWGNWTPIGSGNSVYNPFTGTFDGQGYVIKNLQINSDAYMDVGLFGYAEKATIKNIGVVDTNIRATNSTYQDAGAVCGEIGSGCLVENCYNTGTIYASSNTSSFVGGIVGFASSGTSIQNCYNTGNIEGYAFSTYSMADVGGIVGFSVIVNNCYNSGTVYGKSSFSWVGGISGFGGETISNCVVLSKNITGESDENHDNEAFYVCYNDSASAVKLNNIALQGIMGNAENDANKLITEDEAKQQNTYTSLGWDFDTVWAIDPNINNGYPYLQAIPPAGAPPITPSTDTSVPSAPTIPIATAGDGKALLAFIPPTTNGSSITGYTVTDSPGGATYTCTGSPIVIDGLTNGVTYTFTVYATNTYGDGPSSVASNAVTPQAGLSLVFPPTDVKAVAGDGQATITFTSADIIGAPNLVTGYKVISSPGGIVATGRSSPITVTGLTNGIAYTFTVVTTSTEGDSAPSNPSNAVMPATAPYPFRFGTNNFSFINSGNYFHMADYQLAQSSTNGNNACMNFLELGMSTDEQTHLQQEQAHSPWGGSCYGMTDVAALICAGDLSPSFWQSDAENAYDLQAPIKNSNIENLINFYQLTQFYPDIEALEKENQSQIFTGTSYNDGFLLRQIIDDLSASQTSDTLPFVNISMAWETSQTDTDGNPIIDSHSILGYQYDIGSFNFNGNNYYYKVYIDDPCDTQQHYLYISQDFKSWDYDGFFDNLYAGYVTTDGLANKCVDLVTNSENLIDIRNPETMADNVVQTTPVAQIDNYKYGQYGSIIVTGADNQTVTYQGFNKIGNLNTQMLIPFGAVAKSNTTDDSNYSSSQTIFLPSEQPYNVTPPDGTSGLDVSALFSQTYMSANAPVGTSATFDPNGTVTANPNGGSYDIASTNNTPVLPWHTIEAKGSGSNDVQLSNAADGVYISGDNLHNVTVTGTNDTETVTLNFTTDQQKVQLRADGNTLVAYVDTDNDGTFETPLTPNDTSNSQGRPSGSANLLSDTTNTPVNTNNQVETPFIAGYPDGTFKPDSSITRAEAATIIYNLLSTNNTADLTALDRFSDIPAGYWADNALAFVVSSGYMQGYPDGTFKPDEPISRAELAQLVDNLGIAKTGGTPQSFSDVSGHWALDAINAMSAAGVINGYPDGTFRPDNPITRAETVAMLARLFNRSQDWSGTQTFSDVPSTYWAYNYIMNAVNGKS